MSFLDKNVPPHILREIFKAASSCSWLGKWKLLSVTNKETRDQLVEAWQESLRKIGQERSAVFVERWKAAPLFVVFCQPKVFEPYQFVPAELVRVYSINEIGSAARSLELMALTYGIGLHGIMGTLVPAIGEGIKQVLHIPNDYEIVSFGIMGYPGEEVPVKFPDLEELCYANSWGSRFHDEVSQ